MSLKHRISSPLEAGPSILDAHHLPPHLNAALDYAAKRLARKGLHVTLLVVRREYQIPTGAAAAAVSLPATTRASLSSSSSSSVSSPTAAVFSPPASPAPFAHSQGPFRSSFTSTLKSLVRSGTHPVLSLDRSSSSTARDWDLDLQRSKTVSPTFSLSSVDSFSTTTTSTTSATSATSFTSRWPLSPTTPASPPPAPTTLTTTTTPTTAAAGDAFGIRLVHAHSLPARPARLVATTLARAAARFRLPPAALPAPADLAAFALPPALVARSLAQREELFAAPGLALLALDHLYTFKGALARYAASAASSSSSTTATTTTANLPSSSAAAVFGTRGPLQLGAPQLALEDAVDELRRFVLANGRRRLRRGELLRLYPGLGCDEGALGAVARMYARAYGAPGEGDGGVECDVDGLSLCPVFEAGEKALPLLPVAELEEGGAEGEGEGEGEVEVEAGSAPYLEVDLESVPESDLETVQSSAHEPEPDVFVVDWKSYGEEVQAEGAEEQDFIIDTGPTEAWPLVDAAATPPKNSPKTTPKTSPVPKTHPLPLLRLQTNFDALPGRRKAAEIVEVPAVGDAADDAWEIPIHLSDAGEDDEHESDEDLTARPTGPAGGRPMWTNSVSIDEIMLSEDRGPDRLGPVTPNGYDDISPTTRGEWGFLVGGQAGRQVGVTTF